MNRQLQIGLIGAGGMGQTHARAWGETPANLHGIVSRSAANAAQLAQQHGAKVFDSLSAMLPEIDVLTICTPTHLHYEMALAAAEAGVHVVCEKPLARTVAQAEEMIYVCAAAEVKLLVGQVVRFFPEYAQAQQKIAAGEIGKPAVIRLKRGTARPIRSGDNWFNNLEQSGGMILDLMIHDFDFARWIGGEVKTVFAQSLARDQKANSDHAVVTLTHENGTVSHVEGSWAHPPPFFHTQIEVSGSHGLIQHDSHKPSAADPPLHADPYIAQIQEFYRHLTADEPLRVSAADGLAALKIGLAACESVKTGRPVTL